MHALGSNLGNLIDMEANKIDVQKQELNQDIRNLEDEKIKVEHTNERLKFIKHQTEAEQQFDKQRLISLKVQTKKNIQKNIEKYAK